MIKKHTGERKVSGVRAHVLAKVARELGFHLCVVFDWFDQQVKLGHSTPLKPTLAKFTRDFRASLREFPVIVNVTGHYVVVHGRTFVDNQVRRPVRLSKAPGRRRRVKKAWKVIPLSNCKLWATPVYSGIAQLPTCTIPAK
jgi:hypothetical protein